MPASTRSMFSAVMADGKQPVDLRKGLPDDGCPVAGNVALNSHSCRSGRSESPGPGHLQSLRLCAANLAPARKTDRLPPGFPPRSDPWDRKSDLVGAQVFDFHIVGQ